MKFRRGIYRSTNVSDLARKFTKQEERFICSKGIYQTISAFIYQLPGAFPVSKGIYNQKGHSTVNKGIYRTQGHLHKEKFLLKDYKLLIFGPGN